MESSVIKLRELRWYERAEVKNALPYEKIEFHEDKWDFLPELMPFSGHILWQDVHEDTKRLVATYGWFMYNLKTIHIETKVISPLCYSMIEGKNQISHSFDFVRIVTQTLVDESFHTLLSFEGIRGIATKRNVQQINLPEFNLFLNFNRALENAHNPREKEIIQMGMVVASEVLISDYLSLIATSKTVQPLCQAITKTHWKDELSHAHVFKLIAEKIMSKLSSIERQFFIDCIVQSSLWFADKELDVWAFILQYLEVPRALEIIEDCKKEYKKSENIISDKRIKTLINRLQNGSEIQKKYALAQGSLCTN